MKKRLTVKTRWEFYASNSIGLAVVLVLVIWFMILAVNDGEINFKSFYFWIALLLLMMVPFALITILSAMKSVIVTEKGLLISYLFRQHKNEVNFSDVTSFTSTVNPSDTHAHSSSLRDSFKLELSDGRVFEFSRSQFDNYGKLKAITYKAVKRN